jgi:hypothetical protein
VSTNLVRGASCGDLVSDTNGDGEEDHSPSKIPRRPRPTRPRSKSQLAPRTKFPHHHSYQTLNPRPGEKDRDRDLFYPSTRPAACRIIIHLGAKSRHKAVFQSPRPQGHGPSPARSPRPRALRIHPARRGPSRGVEEIAIPVFVSRLRAEVYYVNAGWSSQLQTPRLR